MLETVAISSEKISPTRSYILGLVLSEDKLLPSGLWLATTTKKGIPPKRVKIIALGKPTYKKKVFAVSVIARDARGTETMHRVTKFKVLYKNGRPIEQPWSYKVGETLYIKKGSGIPIWIDQKDHLFLKRGDILGVE